MSGRIVRLQILVWTAAALLGLGSVFAVGGRSGQGESIANLESRKDALNKDILILKQEVDLLGSLKRVAFEAKKAGFVFDPSAFDFASPPALASSR